MELKEELKESAAPSIVFKVRNNLFSINSEYITTLLQLPKYEAIPNAPPCLSGLFPYRGEMIGMFDLRIALGYPSLKEEYDEFAAMLEERKQDHIDWVSELERTIETGEPFLLTTDPHQCTFGRWYDQFKSENHSVMHHLRRVDEPHKKLHQAALQVEQCSQICDQCQREICMKEILNQVKGEAMPEILKLLDETKEIFRSNVYHEMVILLGGGSRLGIVVDEVLSVDKLSPVGEEHSSGRLQASPYILGLKRSEKLPGVILELDAPKIIGQVVCYPECS